MLLSFFVCFRRRLLFSFCFLLALPSAFSSLRLVPPQRRSPITTAHRARFLNDYCATITGKAHVLSERSVRVKQQVRKSVCPPARARISRSLNISLSISGFPRRLYCFAISRHFSTLTSPREPELISLATQASASRIASKWEARLKNDGVTRSRKKSNEDIEHLSLGRR